ncbi:hypothetical protein JMJ77_0013276, partial [Colletotrichum scovillei]
VIRNDFGVQQARSKEILTALAERSTLHDISRGAMIPPCLLHLPPLSAVVGYRWPSTGLDIFHSPSKPTRSSLEMDTRLTRLSSPRSEQSTPELLAMHDRKSQFHRINSGSHI